VGRTGERKGERRKEMVGEKGLKAVKGMK